MFSRASFPPSWVQVVEGEVGARSGVHPVQAGVDPKAGLVAVDDRGSPEQLPHQGAEQVQLAGTLADHGHDGPGRHRRSVSVGQQLGHPGDGEVLAGHQVTDQGPQTRAVAGGG